jgi:hypothetical protein
LWSVISNVIGGTLESSVLGVVWCPLFVGWVGGSLIMLLAFSEGVVWVVVVACPS